MHVYVYDVPQYWPHTYILKRYVDTQAAAAYKYEAEWQFKSSGMSRYIKSLRSSWHFEAPEGLQNIWVKQSKKITRETTQHPEPGDFNIHWPGCSNLT